MHFFSLFSFTNVILKSYLKSFILLTSIHTRTHTRVFRLSFFLSFSLSLEAIMWDRNFPISRIRSGKNIDCNDRAIVSIKCISFVSRGNTQVLFFYSPPAIVLAAHQRISLLPFLFESLRIARYYGSFAAESFFHTS